jgi:type IV secretory pathway TraG/TraD family ATPase VirD4
MAQEFVNIVGGVDADTILRMGQDEQLLLIEGGAPTRAKQVRYYEDRAFAR